jgi:hypothetical protein
MRAAQQRLPSPTPTSAHQRESQDSLGIGKLVEGQMRAVIEIIKTKGLLNEPPPPTTGDRGIVIAGGGKYEEWALVNCMWLRQRGVTLPIQVFYLGAKEISRRLRPYFEKLDVELVDAQELRKTHWMRRLGGWELKAYAAARCRFDEVCFVDADCLLSVDPSVVWDDPEYQEKGALFFSDMNKCRLSQWHYFYAQVPIPEKEFESGVFFWNRQRSWPGILMTMWILQHSEVWFRLTYGDKETFYLGFETMKTPFVQSMECSWAGWGILQKWKGTEVARHLMAYKRKEAKSPEQAIDHLFEKVRMLGP